MTPGQCCAGWLAMCPPRPGTMSGRTDGRRWYGSRTSEKCPFFHVAGSDTWRVWTRWWLNGRRSGRNADWSRATPASTDRPMSRTHPVRRCHQRRSSSSACCHVALTTNISCLVSIASPRALPTFLQRTCIVSTHRLQHQLNSIHGI